MLGSVCLGVPGVIAYRPIVLRVVAEACVLFLGPPWEHAHGHVDVQQGELFQHELLSAVGEAFNNITFHGYSGMAPGAVAIEIQWTLHEISIALSDTGLRFDPSRIEPPMLDSMPERGMGLFIMRSCLDELDYQPGPPNVLRMIKRRRFEGRP